MKNLFKFIAYAVVATVALVSCQQEMPVSEQLGEISIMVKATPDALANEGTKTYIDDNNTIIWGTGEYMKLAVKAGNNTTFATSLDATADLFDGDEEAMFQFSIAPGTADTYTYMGVYPASSVGTSSNNNAESYKVTLPEIQNATSSSYDPAAYIMVAQPEEFTSVETEWEASYRRATALNKITLTGIDDDILAVEFTAVGYNLAGSRYINLTTGRSGDVYAGGNSVAVKYAITLPANSDKVIWFTSWGATIEEGNTLKIVAKSATNTYTRTLTARAGGIKFQEGCLNKLNVDMTNAAVGSVDDVAGDYLILARRKVSDPDVYEYHLVKGEANGTRLAAELYEGSIVSYNGPANKIWTSTKSGNSYTLQCKGSYLAWPGGSDNIASLLTEYDATKCLMSIDSNSDGTYKITNTNTSARYLGYNSGNDWFAFYGAAGQYGDLVLVPATILPQVATPTFSEAAGAVDADTEVTISTTTAGATIYYTTDGSTPTSSSTSGNVVTVDQAMTIKAIAVKDGMVDSEVASVKYTIKGTIDYPSLETSNVTLTISGGTSASEATVNGYDAIKVGTTSSGGKVCITVPARTVKLHLHAAAWTGVSGLSLNITGASSITPSSIALTSNSGITGSSPFTIQNDNASSYYHVIELSGIDVETTLTFATSISKRFVIWGVNYEDKPDNRVDVSLGFNGNSSYEFMVGSADYNAFTALSATSSPSGMSPITYSILDPSNITSGFSTSDGSFTLNGNAGTATITASFAGDEDNYKPASASYSVTVVGEPNDGTLEHPYTVAEALEIISGYAANGVSPTEVYVKGVVSQIDSYNSNYNSLTYYISDDGTTTNQLQVYGGKYLSGSDFTSADDIAVHDIVIIYGELKNYNGSTPEINTGSMITSLNGKLALGIPTVTATPDDSNKTIAVSWDSIDGATSYDVTCGSQTVSDLTVTSYTFTMSNYGNYDISVTAKAANCYSATGTASASLTDPNSTINPTTVSVNIGSYASSHSWANGTQYSDVQIDTYVTATASGGGNTGKYYDSGSNWRLYQNESATLTIDAGSKTITSVTITYAITNTGVLKYNDSNVTSGTAINNLSTSSITFSVGNTGTVTNGQVRVTNISVTYQ